MKTCPVCGMRFENAVPQCNYCNYKERPMEEYSKTQIHKALSRFEYEKAEDGGYRILRVKNPRAVDMRDSLGIAHFVTEISSGAFSHCKFITDVDLPYGLRSIGDNAFIGCKNLAYIFIPESVERMGKEIFGECEDLAEIHCAAPEKPEGWDDGWTDGFGGKVKWGCKK